MKLSNFLLAIITFVVSLIFLPKLPAQIPMHWNVRGEVDNLVAKETGIWFIPAMILAISLLFGFLPMFDPKKDKYKLFKKEWDIMQTGIIGFLVYLQFITIYISLNPQTSILPLMFMGLGVLFVLIGNFLSKIRQNYFIGIKTPWALADEDNWNKTHRYGSWCFVIAGILILAEAYFIWYAPIVILGSILLTAFLPFVYSFLLFKKAESKMKLVYLGIGISFLIVTILRFATAEDTWLCDHGLWVKHGHPDNPAPLEECR